VLRVLSDKDPPRSFTPYTGFFFLTYPTPDPPSRLLPPSPLPAFHEDACAVVVRSGAERERERERKREREEGREREIIRNVSPRIG